MEEGEGGLLSLLTSHKLHPPTEAASAATEVALPAELWEGQDGDETEDDAVGELTAWPAAPVFIRPRKPAMTFEQVVERYHPKVFQLVYRYTGNYEEACDLTQDTFVRAYGAWQDFRGDSQVYTWLYRIAINLCHNQQKKLQRRYKVERLTIDSRDDEDSDHHKAQEIADERPLPMQVLESNELRVRLQEALLELPDNYRTVIMLRDIEGLSYDEIARITDSSLEAIKSRLFRARNAIRRLLTPYLMGEPKPTAAVETRQLA